MSTQEKQAIVVGVLIGLAVLVVCYYLFYIPMQRQMGEAQRKNAELDKQRRDLQAYLDDRETRDAEAARIRKFEHMLPEEREVPQLFDYLRDIANDTGIEFIAIRSQESQNKNLLKVFPFEIDLKSSYHQLGEFLEKIEVNQKRFLRVDDIQLISSEENPTLHDASVVVTTFVYTGVPAKESGNGN
jgi:Tfp pilus assembly protein PilO